MVERHQDLVTINLVWLIKERHQDLVLVQEVEQLWDR